MKFKDLLGLYHEYKVKYGEKVFNYISELLQEAKLIHKKSWDKSPTPNKDHEQSWRAFKGKNLEKLILYIIKEQLEKLGLKIVEGNTLEKRRSENLSEELNKVKRNLLVHYGEFGSHMPDVDLIVYNPENFNVLAVISSKVTLRERIAQTGYWKLKLLSDSITKNIKVFLITPDEDGTLIKKFPPKKGRAIVEIDTDGCYLMTDKKIDESEKVKNFASFINDLKKLMNNK